ncbi:hypothetical protein MTO96_015080 [Rhipicephalus appendiculatus]
MELRYLGLSWKHSSEAALRQVQVDETALCDTHVVLTHKTKVAADRVAVGVEERAQLLLCTGPRCDGGNYRSTYFDGSPDDEISNHSNAHHNGRSINDDDVTYGPLHGQHRSTCRHTRSPQPGGSEHHDSTADYHNGQAKQRQPGCSVLGGNAGFRALPRLHVVPRTEEGARRCCWRLDPSSAINSLRWHLPPTIQQQGSRSFGGNPPWSRGGPALAAPGKLGPNITCKEKERKEKGGSQEMVRQSLRNDDEAERSAHHCVLALIIIMVPLLVMVAVGIWLGYTLPDSSDTSTPLTFSTSQDTTPSRTTSNEEVVELKITHQETITETDTETTPNEELVKLKITHLETITETATDATPKEEDVELKITHQDTITETDTDATPKEEDVELKITHQDTITETDTDATPKEEDVELKITHQDTITETDTDATPEEEDVKLKITHQDTITETDTGINL